MLLAAEVRDVIRLKLRYRGVPGIAFSITICLESGIGQLDSDCDG